MATEKTGLPEEVQKAFDKAIPPKVYATFELIENTLNDGEPLFEDEPEKGTIILKALLDLYSK